MGQGEISQKNMGRVSGYMCSHRDTRPRFGTESAHFWNLYRDLVKKDIRKKGSTKAARHLAGKKMGEREQRNGRWEKVRR
jgi:hypothetical protein